jgi:hypothetical protein
VLRKNCFAGTKIHLRAALREMARWDSPNGPFSMFSDPALPALPSFLCRKPKIGCTYFIGSCMIYEGITAERSDILTVQIGSAAMRRIFATGGMGP